MFYKTEQMRLELQEADVYELIGMYRTEKNMDFSETMLTGVHSVAHALMQVEPANELLTCEGDTGSISTAVSVAASWVLGQNFA